MQPPPIGFLARIVLAYVAFFRVLFDGAFAARVRLVEAGMPELPPPAPEKPARQKVKEPSPPPEPKVPATPPVDVEAISRQAREAGAIWILGALQREGRLVDFLEQDVASFSDGDVGAAARVVHAGVKRALKGTVEIEPIRTEEEGTKVTLEEGFDPRTHKLTGDVKGKPPFVGVLRHKGWRAAKLNLPSTLAGEASPVLCEAEVEL